MMDERKRQLWMDDYSPTRIMVLDDVPLPRPPPQTAMSPLRLPASDSNTGLQQLSDSLHCNHEPKTAHPDFPTSTSTFVRDGDGVISRWLNDEKRSCISGMRALRRGVIVR